MYTNIYANNKSCSCMYIHVLNINTAASRQKQSFLKCKQLLCKSLKSSPKTQFYWISLNITMKMKMIWYTRTKLNHTITLNNNIICFYVDSNACGVMMKIEWIQKYFILYVIIVNWFVSSTCVYVYGFRLFLVESLIESFFHSNFIISDGSDENIS